MRLFEGIGSYHMHMKVTIDNYFLPKPRGNYPRSFNMALIITNTTIY